MVQNYSYAPLPSLLPSQHGHQPIQPAPANMADPRSLPSQPYPPHNHGGPHYNYPPPPSQQDMGYHTPASSQYTHEAPLSHPLPPMAVPEQGYGQPAMDTTGQIAPPGMRLRLTTSVFEEEGSVCYQVDVDGICVARREDNHMINGTKLLNVARMTRGRRDGILKAEKQKNVVKIGPMHLKGVWIPYERALALANQEKITEHLYPLFVHNIGSLLYHPSNAARPMPLPPTYPPQHREHQELPPLQFAVQGGGQGEGQHQQQQQQQHHHQSQNQQVPPVRL